MQRDLGCRAVHFMTKAFEGRRQKEAQGKVMAIDLIAAQSQKANNADPAGPSHTNIADLQGPYCRDIADPVVQDPVQRILDFGAILTLFFKPPLPLNKIQQIQLNVPSPNDPIYLTRLLRSLPRIAKIINLNLWADVAIYRIVWQSVWYRNIIQCASSDAYQNQNSG